MSELKLRSVDFRREREAGWRELDRLVGRADKGGVQALTADELAALPGLYRGALSSLSVARSISLDRNVTEYLEGLCARAYITVYGARGNTLDAILRFLTRGFPAEVRRHARLLLIASAFMVAGAVTAFFMTGADMNRYYAFVSADLAGDRNPAASTELLAAALRDSGKSAMDDLSVFASYLFTHNSQVGMLCFVSGFLFGIPVFFLLFMNGMILGAMAALYHDRGLSLEFWGWILPHGITELGAITVCGAAGLALGRSQLFPGVYRRVHTLAIAGRQAARLVAGAICMFLIAGLIEGIFRQTVESTAIRWAVALTTTLLWWLYLRSGARGVGDAHGTSGEMPREMPREMARESAR